MTLFNVDDRVFAKLKGYPHWPARVLHRLEGDPKGKIRVMFYGTFDIGFCLPKSLIPFTQASLEKHGSQSKREAFNEAMYQIQNEPNAGKLIAEPSEQMSAPPPPPPRGPPQPDERPEQDVSETSPGLSGEIMDPVPHMRPPGQMVGPPPPGPQPDHQQQQQQSSLEELYSVVKCTVCQASYRNPQTLDCGHTYCKECIDRMFTVRNRGDLKGDAFRVRVECGQCRMPIKSRRSLRSNHEAATLAADVRRLIHKYNRDLRRSVDTSVLKIRPMIESSPEDAFEHCWTPAPKRRSFGAKAIQRIQETQQVELAATVMAVPMPPVAAPKTTVTAPKPTAASPKPPKAGPRLPAAVPEPPTPTITAEQAAHPPRLHSSAISEIANTTAVDDVIAGLTIAQLADLVKRAAPLLRLPLSAVVNAPVKTATKTAATQTEALTVEQVQNSVSRYADSVLMVPPAPPPTNHTCRSRPSAELTVRGPFADLFDLSDSDNDESPVGSRGTTGRSRRSIDGDMKRKNPFQPFGEEMKWKNPCRDSDWRCWQRGNEYASRVVH